MKIQLKINGEWAVLPPDFSLKMMKMSPLFSDQGDFSYPFELPVEPNRHIFGPIADPMGFVRLREFHALPAEIWFEGNQVFVGQTEVSGEQTFSKRGKVSFNVVSNNGAFKDMISGLNCRDVKLKDKIKLGWRPKYVQFGNANTVHFRIYSYYGVSEQAHRELWNELKTWPQYLGVETDKGGLSTNTYTFHEKDFDRIDMPKGLLYNTETNVSEPYPYKPYCNVRICCSRGEDSKHPSETANKKSTGNGYMVYEPDALNAAPSFYLLYFVESLFKHVSVNYDISELSSVGDLSRVAMFNTCPSYTDDDDSSRVVNWDGLMRSYEEDSSLTYVPFRCTLSVHAKRLVYRASDGSLWADQDGKNTNVEGTDFDEVNAKYVVVDCYADGGNFSNTEVKNVIDDMFNAFGILFCYDQQNNFIKAYNVKDIMKDSDVLEPQCFILQDIYVERYNKNGVIVSFGGSEDDTNYLYSMPRENEKDGKIVFELYADYLSISSIVRSSGDIATKYDLSTGDAYRIKVNKETGNEPQLIEVGGLRPYKIGVAKDDYYRNHYNYKDEDEREPGDATVYADRDESTSENIKINFTPVTVNDIWSYLVNKDKTDELEYEYPTSAKDSSLAVFVNTESIGDTDMCPVYSNGKEDGERKMLYSEAEFDHLRRRTSKYTINDDRYKKEIHQVEYTFRMNIKVCGPAVFDASDGEGGSPINKVDAGYVLGIMRGPGNESSEEHVLNYDGEGNDTWYHVASSPAFTVDSIDNYGNVFDYNGASGEGVDDGWVTKHVTPYGALTYLRTFFSRSNVPFDDDRARSTQVILHTSSVLGQLGINISFLVSTKDKDGITVSLSNAIAYIHELAKQVGANINSLYKADKEAKRIIVYGDPTNVMQYKSLYDSLIGVYASGNDGDVLVKVDDLSGRLSLKLDARKVKEYDKDGNPVYFDVTDNTVARRGLVPQLLEDFLYFKAHHVKVTFPVLMSLSAINNLQLLKWNRFGDYVGLIKQVNYELTESGLRNVTVELLVANK